MPRQLPRPCLHPGCPKLSPTGRCADHQKVEHKRQREQRDPTSLKLYHSARWQRLRRMVLAGNPVCVDCKAALASEVDHRVRMAEGGEPWSMDNLQALCKPCHSRKTAQEVLVARPAG